VEVYRKLKEYYWPYRYVGFLSIMFVFFTTGLALARPNLLRIIIDDVLVQGKYQKLPYLAGGVFLAAILQAACQYGRNYLGHVFGANSVYEVRNALYRRLQSLSFSYYDTAKTGDLMSRLAGDVEVFRQFLAFGFAGLVDFVLMVSFGLIMMAMLDWKLMLLSLITMPFLAFHTIRFHLFVHPAFTHLREAMSDMSTAVQESVTGIRTVKSFAREPQQIDTFTGRVNAFVDAHMNTAKLWARYFPTMELMGNLAVLALLYYGGREALSGRISVGSLVAFFQLIWMIIGPLQQLGFHIYTCRSIIQD
jgi:ATP-binding cassette subfamily B protein